MRSAALLLALALASPAAAADELAVDAPVDAAITGGAGLAYLLSEVVFKRQLVPASCRWCDDDLNGLDAGVRDALRWDDTGTAATLADVAGFGLAPATGLGLLAVAALADDRGAAWPGDALVVLESAVLAADVNQAVKLLAGRRRPFVRFSPVPRDGVDDNLSFYSGHTTFAFALAVASGTVAEIRGYHAAPAVWAVGLGVAATTGYLRIAADRHYATDVLVGALVGSAIGFSVPWLFHRRAGGPELAVAPASVALRVAW